jgi:hypothetical protein
MKRPPPLVDVILLDTFPALILFAYALGELLAMVTR